ncbi:hypothetical protein CMK14_12880 [Candidatus Poribacteria bacterium]|nr:hypothetical protein [Candidatus Poribacteria bacterium]
MFFSPDIVTRSGDPVCRLGLATRGNTHLASQDVAHAIGRGINYLNWCGHPDGMSQAIRQLSNDQRGQIVIATQFSARRQDQARRELDQLLDRLGTSWIDVLTFYYVETEEEWETISGKDGALGVIQQARDEGVVRLIGLTTHQRKLAARRAERQEASLLMIRYNAAHRGAEQEVFPVTASLKIPVVTFTGLRWGALLKSTAEDPPQTIPPTAQDCYRFVLSNSAVSVGLTAPNDRIELEETLNLFNDWRPLTEQEMKQLRDHGDRVHRTSGQFL